MGQKYGGLCPFRGVRARSPSNTMWPGPRPTCMPSFILIRPTIWPQCTNVTDSQDRQRSDSIGRTVLQTVAQRWSKSVQDRRPKGRIALVTKKQNKFRHPGRNPWGDFPHFSCVSVHRCPSLTFQISSTQVSAWGSYNRKTSTRCRSKCNTRSFSL